MSFLRVWFAVNGRLEHLRGSAPGFRDLTNYTPDPSSKPEDPGRSCTFDCDVPLYVEDVALSVDGLGLDAHVEGTWPTALSRGSFRRSDAVLLVTDRVIDGPTYQRLLHGVHAAR